MTRDQSAAGGARPRPRTPSAEVEAALVDAAERVLVRRGQQAITVRAVATEAGVAPMGIYNRFGGKDGLIAALLVRGFDLLLAAVAVHGETDPIQRLRNSGLRYREFAITHPQYYAMMFAGELPCDDRTKVEEHAGAAFAELVGHVQHALDAGVLHAGDPTEIAQQLWSAIHGAVSLELNGLSTDADSTFEALLDTLVRGLAPSA